MCFSLSFLSYSLVELLKRPHKAATANILRVNHKLFVWYCYNRLKSNYKHFLNVKVPFLTITKRFFLPTVCMCSVYPSFYRALHLTPACQSTSGLQPTDEAHFCIIGFVRMFLHFFSTVGVFFAALSWTLSLPCCSPRMYPTHTPTISGSVPVGMTHLSFV